MEATGGQRTPISLPDGSHHQANKAKGHGKISSDFCGMLRRVLPNAAATAARVLQNILCGLETK